MIEREWEEFIGVFMWVVVVMLLMIEGGVMLWRTLGQW